MAELEQYLKGKSEEGLFQSSGGFAVDYAKALQKRKAYTLDLPELWIIRLLQAAAGLGATLVNITVGRKTLLISARLLEDSLQDHPLEDLFRVSEDNDPRISIQDAIWGAVGRDYDVEIAWLEKGQPRALSITDQQLQFVQSKANIDPDTLLLKVSPRERRGLLHKLFGKADFSAEFQAVAQRGFFAPFELLLDSRPYDFEDSSVVGDEASLEIRAHRAQAGPRIRAHQRVRSILEVSEKAGRKFALTSTSSCFDYLFLLKAEWDPENPARPTVHWIKDGFESAKLVLFDWESPLRLQFFFPAEGLDTDLSHLIPIQNETYKKRLKNLLTLAYFSLVTPPLFWNRGLPEICEQASSEAEQLLAELNRSKQLSPYGLQAFEKTSREFRSQALQSLDKKMFEWNLQRLNLHETATESNPSPSESWVRLSDFEASRFSDILIDSLGDFEVDKHFLQGFYIRLLSDGKTRGPKALTQGLTLYQKPRWRAARKNPEPGAPL